MSQFPLIRVSKQSRRLVLALETALMFLAEADERDLEAVGEAYSKLSMVRESLYKHLALLERKANPNLPQDVILRF